MSLCRTVHQQQRRLCQGIVLNSGSVGGATTDLLPEPPGQLWQPQHHERGASMQALPCSSSTKGWVSEQLRSGPPSPTFAMSALSWRGNRSISNAKKIEHTPVSKAIALLVSQDTIPRDRLVTFMSKLCQEMVLEIDLYNTTEVAAFCEAAMKMDYCTQQLADAVLDYLPGKVSELSGVELPGLMWVVAKKDDVDPQLSTDLCEALHRHLDEVQMEDLAALIPIVCSICPASPFLLSALAEEVMAHLKEFSAAEVSALVTTFGCEVVRRSLFDDRIFKGLASAILRRVPEFTQLQLRSMLAVFRDICGRHHTLAETLRQIEAELVPLTSPSPQ